ncbi:DNA-binding protein [Chryseobacterium lactis]|uniref:DNA-binding protein n=2 Tax=Chryseobacterium TaxID=59732 RepID=A0A3G6RCL7_CHRLC|nr:helix-turn-helix domain-containing protein [Chryseobacterium lactis]AZA82134.1 DNA-binding protein [Chryseobacterium lactis]AZB02515.1 DNA-binding protein [Chryseobacterium lactis]PNW14189.1 DNA-binding protein [Chryseobacterium lactis]
MENIEKKILSFKEAVLFMDVSKSLLYKLTSEGRINFFKPNNGKVYFRKEDLENWMMQNEVKSITSLEESIIDKMRTSGRKY